MRSNNVKGLEMKREFGNYESAALPTELRRLIQCLCGFLRFRLVCLSNNRLTTRPSLFIAALLSFRDFNIR